MKIALWLPSLRIICVKCGQAAPAVEMRGRRVECDVPCGCTAPDLRLEFATREKGIVDTLLLEPSTPRLQRGRRDD